RIEPQNPSVQDFVGAVGLPIDEQPAIIHDGPALDAAEPRRSLDAAEPPFAIAAPIAAAPTAAAPAAAAPTAAAIDALPVPVQTPIGPAPLAPPPAAAPAAPVAAPAVHAAVSHRARTPSTQVPLDLDAAMLAARASEASGDRGVAAWKDVVTRHPQSREA